MDRLDIDELNYDMRTGLTEQQEKEIKGYEEMAFGLLCGEPEFIRDFICGLDDNDIVDFFEWLGQKMAESPEMKSINKGSHSHYMDDQPLSVLKDYAKGWDDLTNKMKLLLDEPIKQKAYELWELNEGESNV